MEFEKTPIADLWIVKPKVFYDERGYFFESFNQSAFAKANIDINFVQDNQSMSSKNVLRGLHFQAPPYEQAKLVRVIKGSVFDVAVDIRKNSSTYGKYFATILSEQNKMMMFIPAGFAHGFLTLEDETIFSYKCSNFYNKAAEGVILWNDSTININWNCPNPILSERDKNAKDFSCFSTPF